MQHSQRGGSFWAFIIGVALGGAVGAVLMHKTLTTRSADTAQAPANRPQSSAPGDNSTEERINRLLREWNLDPDQIRRELDRAGAVVKRSGRAIGDRLGEATLDARIITIIKAKYTLDRELSAWDISVASDHGHVTLSGTVNSPDLIGRAVVVALETQGVIDVASSLRVKANATPPLPPVES